MSFIFEERQVIVVRRLLEIEQERENFLESIEREREIEVRA